MTFITSTLGRYALYITLAAGLLLGGFSYRSHVYDAGRVAGTGAAMASASEARLLADRAGQLASERATQRMGDTFLRLKADHDQVTARLSQALLDSDHQRQRLSARIVGLLDSAAGVRPGPPGDPGSPGGPAGTPEGDSTVAALIETTNENYAICLRNSARLAGLQAWYSDLRNGSEK